MPEPESIGRRVKRERSALGLTQRQLAERIGVGVPHVSKIEAGRENPSDELLARLAEAFGVDADELGIVARRLPDDVLDRLASSPTEALEFLRKWER